MKNSEVIQTMVSYIKSVMKQKNLSERQLVELCQKATGESITQKTINNMFSRPSSTTISTLLKVCDGLDLNLTAIFHSIELAKTAENSKNDRLIYDINFSAYKGYTGKYHVFFLPTSQETDTIQEKDLIHGVLEFGDRYSINECTAVLDIDSGDYTLDGEPFTKHYEGTLVYSSNSMMFCNLVCSQYGDMWFLVFDHGNLNNKDLACVMGCAATSSSGRIRHPAIHRFCLCNMQQYPEINETTRNLLQGILRLQNKYIFVEKETVEELLKSAELDPTFHLNLETHLKIAKEYYALSKDVLKERVAPTTAARIFSELSSHSGLERVYQIRHSDDVELTHILKHSISDTQP